VPIDRETTLRQAEKLQREGRIDLAIAEYVRLVAEQPRDWNSINALGDLYLRTGDVERAVAQFTQIADHLFAEGFRPKAAAVYKKALKAKPDHEHALLRLSEIAAAQELLADARAHLRKLWELRSERGDDDAAAECLVRLAALPEADVETKLTGGRAARMLGETQRAAELFRSAAEDLEKAGRSAAALDARAQVVALDPADVALRRQVVTQYVAAGQMDEAGQLLNAETAGADPELLLALASLELARRDDGAGCATLTRLIDLAPDRVSDVLRLAGDLGRAGEAERAFACSSVVVDAAVRRADWDRAIDVLQSFLVHGAHIPALVRLVQVSEHAGAEEILNEAQERLLATYLDGGHGAEAQAVAEGLLARAPDSAVHAQRLRRALELAGAEDPDAGVRAVLDRLRPPPPAFVVPEPALVVEDDLLAGAFDDVADITVVTIDDDVPLMSMDEALAEFETPAAPAVQPPPVVPDTPRPEEPVEIDLSDVMAALRSSSPQPPSAAPAADEFVSDLSDLESVLNAMRPRSADYQTVTEGASVYERGLQRLEQGQVQEGLADLVEAARVPAMRFQAAARIGREYIKRGQAQAGIDWLGRAAEMPAPSPEAGLGVLYDLAAALDHIGERVRAFAVLMEISAEDPGYRDVAQRLEVLARVEDERRG
jgi:tetratricopeptide (TPR) repeat protein